MTSVRFDEAHWDRTAVTVDYFRLNEDEPLMSFSCFLVKYLIVDVDFHSILGTVTEADGLSKT